MDIELTSTTPINARPYRVAFAQREKVKESLNELLQANIIKKSSSQYPSPVVLVPKKNGEILRTPRANGQVERANQLILSFLRTSAENTRRWDLQLRDLQWSVNSQRNATSGFTPNELVFDFRLRDILQNRILGAIHDDVIIENNLSMNEKRVAAAQNIAEERKRWKLRFDKQHKSTNTYAVGDLVVGAYEPPATGESRKMAPKYRGPYAIIKVLGNDRYVLGDIPGVHITQRAFDSVYASDKLKRWCNASPELDGQSVNEDDRGLEDEPMSGEAEM